MIGTEISAAAAVVRGEKCRSGYGDNVRAAGRRIRSQLVYRGRIEEIGVASDKDASTTLGKKYASST
ncbi:unnamed protein product [Sphagnum balticum]